MHLNRPLLVLGSLVVVSCGLAGFVAACASDSPATADDTLDGSADATTDTKRPAVDTGVETDAGAPSTCELTRTYTTDCQKLLGDAGDDLTCGDAKFDAWCASNDSAINSASFRRAEAMCLTKANCDGLDRRHCEYRTYATATPTAAQKAIVAAYCQTCEPSDPTGCATRKTVYDPALGPKSTDDVFVAAWELGDPLCDEIRTKCTGSALDAGAGPDAGVCLKAFANCAGGVYLDRVPNCP